MNDLPAECPISTEHLNLHLSSAHDSIGIKDWDQVVHELDIALRIAKELQS